MPQDLGHEMSFHSTIMSIFKPRRPGSSGQIHSTWRAVTPRVAFSHPDYTVGFGVSPNHACVTLAGCTADRELGLKPSPCPKGYLFN